MHRFANAYIVLFLIDTVFSLIDEVLIFYGSAVPVFTGLRVSVATLVVVLSMIFYACLGIDRRLPKRAFLIMTLYTFWCSIALWPLSGIVGYESIGLAASVGQVIAAGLVIILIHGMYGRLLLPKEPFQKDLFSLSNTLAFTAINLLLTPFFLIYSCLAMAGYYLEQQTAGFLRISPVGIYMAERSYYHNDKEIRLAGMMHIGKEDYYEDLAGSMTDKGAIILAEGVTDRDRLLKHQFNYNNLAGIIGLRSQETMHINGNLVDLERLEEGIINRQNKPDIAHADIDLNRFDPQTVEFLNMLGRTLLSDRHLLEALDEYNAWVEEKMSPESIAGIMTDIIDKRNEAVIGSMVRTLKQYDTIIIPWGAMHMPAIQAAVLEQGFVPGEEKERLSLDFSTIPYGELWQKWSSQFLEQQEQNY
jgi:hypothetical protein